MARHGRPATAETASKTLDKVSEYPKLSISIRPETRALLDAICYIQNRPIWQVVEDGIKAYAAAMPEEDRRMVEQLSARKR